VSAELDSARAHGAKQKDQKKIKVCWRVSCIARCVNCKQTASLPSGETLPASRTRGVLWLGSVRRSRVQYSKVTVWLLSASFTHHKRQGTTTRFTAIDNFIQRPAPIRRVLESRTHTRCRGLLHLGHVGGVELVGKPVATRFRHRQEGCTASLSTQRRAPFLASQTRYGEYSRHRYWFGTLQQL
jgi:hypothetical protein